MAISAKKRLDTYKRDQYRCVDCGSRNRLTIDHITPLEKGGTDDPENLQTMCYWCNQAKGNHVKKWWHKLIPFVSWRDYTKLRNEMMGAMISKDVLLERSFVGKLDKRFNDVRPKVTEYIQEGLKIAEKNAVVKLTGLNNSVDAYSKRSLERDQKLLEYMKIVVERLEVLEDRLS